MIRSARWRLRVEPGCRGFVVFVAGENSQTGTEPCISRLLLLSQMLLTAPLIDVLLIIILVRLSRDLLRIIVDSCLFQSERPGALILCSRD